MKKKRTIDTRHIHNFRNTVGTPDRGPRPGTADRRGHQSHRSFFSFSISLRSCNAGKCKQRYNHSSSITAPSIVDDLLVLCSRRQVWQQAPLKLSSNVPSRRSAEGRFDASMGVAAREATAHTQTHTHVPHSAKDHNAWLPVDFSPLHVLVASWS